MLMTASSGSDDERVSKANLLARLAKTLSIDRSAFQQPNTLEPVRNTSSGLDGHKPVDLALSQALDRLESPELRDHLERLLRTLEAERKSR